MDDLIKFSSLLPLLLALLSGPQVIAKKSSCFELFKLAIKFQPMDEIPYKKFIYASGEILASHRGIEIESFVKNSHLYKNMAQTLAEKIYTFDQHMADLGFQIPKPTRFVLLEPGQIQILRSGFIVGSTSGNLIWRRNQGLQQIIIINIHKGVFSVPTILQDHTALFLHEYTHNILFRSYNKFTFINSGHSNIEEALADFFPAHELETPLSGKNEPWWIRDIEKKIFYESDRTELQRKFGKEAYIDSIHYSNALWEIRQALSNATFSSLIKNFVDNLNLYRDSFVALKGWDTKKIKYEKRAIDELEFFLAVFKRTVADTNNEEDMLKIDRIISEIADELGLDADRIGHASQTITKSENDISYDLATEIRISHIAKYIIHFDISLQYALIASVSIPAGVMLYNIYKYIASKNFNSKNP